MILWIKKRIFKQSYLIISIHQCTKCTTMDNASSFWSIKVHDDVLEIIYEQPIFIYPTALMGPHHPRRINIVQAARPARILLLEVNHLFERILHTFCFTNDHHILVVLYICNFENC